MRTIQKMLLPASLRTHWKRILLVLIALVAVAVVIYFAVFHVFKTDYRHTLTQVNQSVTDYNKLLNAREDVVASVSATDASFATALDSYKKEAQAYTESLKPIATERSLKTADVRASYNALVKKSAAFETYINSRLQLLPLVHTATVACKASSPLKVQTSDLGKIVEAYDSATKSCVNAMKPLATAKDTAVVTKAKTAVKYFSDMRTHAVGMQSAYSADDRATFESEYNSLLEAEAKYKTYATIDDVLAVDTSVVPNAELNSLTSVLAAHAK